MADFGTVDSYFPSVVDCQVEGTGIGARRVLTTTDGGVVSELIELDEERLVMGDRIAESALPFEDYTSQVSVRAGRYRPMRRHLVLSVQTASERYR